ncbi:MAG: hypothetical protein JXR25_02485 [Pontiellaceae bacterium]|nr:hypothetical protein [Pontiellaceae bacterium]MBN2783669.1 hypothetical protein [Pontiellaceae bacterium]
MMNAKTGWICLLAMSVAGVVTAGDLVPDFDDWNAIYDSTNAEMKTVTAPTLANGATFAVQVTPTAADITASQTGTVNLIELGGTSNGSALMIKNGNFIFVTKRGANANSPTLDDTDGSDAMLGVTLGAATAGLDTQIWVSFDGGAGAICYSINGVVQQQVLTGTGSAWNWTGNNSISFGMMDTNNIGWRAGLADYGDYASEPYPADNFAAALSVPFSGTVTRGQYFNASHLLAAPPASVSATLTNVTQVLLEWTPGILAESYNIYRSTSSGVYGAALATGVTELSYVDATSVVGVEYFYVISIVDAEGNESVETTDEISIVTDTVPPDAPTGLALTQNSALFELSWDANTEADFASYSVYRSTVNGTFGEPVATGITDTGYSSGAPELGVTYYYIITAVDNLGNESDVSGQVSGTVSSIDDIRLFFITDNGAIYGFNSIASNALNTVDAGRLTNGMLLATIPAYSNYQGVAISPDNTVYGIDADGDVLSWTSPSTFLAGTAAGSLVATGTYEPTDASEKIHGASYDGVSGEYYAVYEGDPADGDIVRYADLAAFINNTPYVTNAAVYGANKANFYYGWGDVPINYTEADTSATTGMPYFQVPGSGQIEAWLSLDAYVGGPQNRKFELSGFSAGAGNIVAAFALIPDATGVVVPVPVLGIQMDTSDVVISWNAVEGATYTLQSSEDLTGSWSDLETGINGVDGTKSVTTPATGAQTFYRVTGE